MTDEERTIQRLEVALEMIMNEYGYSRQEALEMLDDTITWNAEHCNED